MTNSVLQTKDHVQSLICCQGDQSTFKNAYSLNCAHKVNKEVAVRLLAQSGRCPVESCRVQITEIKEDAQFQDVVDTLKTIYHLICSLEGDTSAPEIKPQDLNRLSRDYVERVIHCPVSLEPFSKAHLLDCAHKVEMKVAKQLFALPNNLKICPQCRAPITLIRADSQFQQVVATIFALYNKLAVFKGEESLSPSIQQISDIDSYSIQMESQNRELSFSRTRFSEWGRVFQIGNLHESSSCQINVGSLSQLVELLKDPDKSNLEVRCSFPFNNPYFVKIDSSRKIMSHNLPKSTFDDIRTILCQNSTRTSDSFRLGRSLNLGGFNDYT